MKDLMLEFVARLEPIFGAFKVPIGAGTALALLTAVVVVSGSDGTSPSRVQTSEAAESQQAIAPAAGEESLSTLAASPTSVRPEQQRPRQILSKGDVSVTVGAGGVPVANLFTAAEDRIGITDTGGKFGKGQITLCGHAATVFGPTFNTSEEDLDVYWRWLDDQGGVHGRSVVTSWEDDAYDPNLAVIAAQACKDKNPFLLLGGIGFEQIPQVRNFAEQNRMPYLHHIARSDLSKKFSFAPLPTVELTGQRAGEWVRRTFPNAKVGIVYRDSEYWIPGKEAFKKALGRPVVMERGVFKNQGNYNQDLLLLRQAGADLVFAWENALAQTLMIREAKDQQWSPQWMVFPFNLVTDQLGNDALNPVLHGISTWPAYSPGDYSGPFAEYADEIKRFEAAYRKYDAAAANAGITDIHWMVWLAWRSIHYTFDQCGRDCTRNKVVGVMLSRPYPYSETRPACATDFTRNGHEGGYWTSMFEAYKRPAGTVGWRHIQHCREGWS